MNPITDPDHPTTNTDTPDITNPTTSTIPDPSNEPDQPDPTPSDHPPNTPTPTDPNSPTNDLNPHPSSKHTLAASPSGKLRSARPRPESVR